MATQYSNGRLVTNGLVLSLNAADPNSYVSGSTTWNDMSGGGNNGTLTNTPTYSSTNGGTFTFNGTNQYVVLGTPTAINNLTTPTVSVWVKFTSVDATAAPITIYDKGYDGSAEGFFLRLQSTNPGTLFVGTYTNGGGNVGATSSTVFTTGTWYNIVGQYTGTAWNIYLNSILNTTFTSATGPQSSTAPISVGAMWNAGAYARFLSGSIPTIHVYNRALSSTEILQNYNVQKSRFGL